MKHLSTFLALLSALTVNVAVAQEVSIDEAQGRAVDFLKSQTDGAKRVKGADVAPQVSLAYTSKNEDKTCFYVFNAGEDEGFVIVGGDEAAHEILGYCDHGSFDYDTAPDNFKWWLSQYTGQIAHAAKVGVKGQRRAKGETSTRGKIQPLIEAKWNQGDPYNRKIVANDNTTGFVTGCVATAMAQVMKKWECPLQGQGSHSYSWGGHTFSADFSTTTYEWNNMPFVYDDFSDAQANAVATLMFHAGVSVDMKYGTNESGANSALIGYALATYFGYDKSVRNEFRKFYSDEDWEDLVYQELLEGRPVLYSGQAESGGHQFICDGYDETTQMFTINWGWGGHGDGSYLLTGVDALKPSFYGTGSGEEGSAYTGSQMIVIGVKPNIGGSEDVHFGQVDCPATGGAMYLKVGNTTYEDNYNYDRSTGYLSGHLYSSLQNLSCISTIFDYGVKAVNLEDNNIIYYSVSETNVSLSRNNYYVDNLTDLNPIAHGLPFNPSNWDEGTYELRPVCRLAGQTDADWIEVDKLLTEIYPTITISGELPSESVMLMEEPYFKNDNNPYEDDLNLHYKVKNNTSSATTVYVLYKIKIGSYTYGRGIYFENVPSSSVIERDLSLDEFKDQFEENKSYTIYFFSDQNRTVPYNYPSITFTYRATLNHNYQVSPAGYGTLILPFNAEVPERMSLYGCDLADENTLQLTKLETEIIERNKPYIVKAVSGETYHFSGPMAIDEKHLFVDKEDGFLYGAVAGDEPLISGVDYIMQYNNNTLTAGFYLYNSETENRKATPYRAFLRIPNRNLAPPVLPNDEQESIEEIRMNHSMPAGIYSLDGKRQSELNKGLNVIILEDGTTKKVFVK